MENQYRHINDLLLYIDRSRRQIGEAAMGDLGILPSQHFMLVQLKRMGRAASQSQIAQTMRVSPASVARTMKSLDRDGYIQRNSGEDARCNEIIVTEKGENVLRHSRAFFHRLDERSYADFSSDEMEQLARLLEKIAKSLSEIREGMEKEMKQ